MWNWIKLPKGIALLAFWLPWVTVSCSGKEVESSTGFGLIAGAGGSDVIDATSAYLDVVAAPNIALALALAVILAGLIVTFRRCDRSNALMVMITNAAALVLIAVGSLRLSKANLMAEAARQNAVRGAGGSDVARPTLLQIDWNLVDIHWQFGFWLTISALIAAGVMAWRVLRDEDAARELQEG